MPYYPKASNNEVCFTIQTNQVQAIALDDAENWIKSKQLEKTLSQILLIGHCPQLKWGSDEFCLVPSKLIHGRQSCSAEAMGQQCLIGLNLMKRTTNIKSARNNCLMIIQLWSVWVIALRTWAVEATPYGKVPLDSDQVPPPLRVKGCILWCRGPNKAMVQSPRANCIGPLIASGTGTKAPAPLYTSMITLLGVCFVILCKYWFSSRACYKYRELKLRGSGGEWPFTTANSSIIN